VILALTLRTVLVTINVVAVVVIIGIIAFKVLSVRREPKEAEAQNLTPFYDDATLEDTHLTRVLRWALIFSTIIAVVLPLYWLLEPGRQTAEAQGFDDRAVERGEILFSNQSMPEFDNTTSLLCANCHGTDANGGSANFVITPEAQGNEKARPIQVTWQAPALNTVLSRMSEEQVNQVITYGRPGTPMPAWGVAGGGPKNEQSVSDLVAYLKSIALSPARARAQVTKRVAAFKLTALGDPSTDPPTKGWVETAQDNLADAQKTFDEATEVPQRLAARLTLEAATKAVDQARVEADKVANASNAELLFETQCARCHTMGWSYFDPTRGLVPLPAPQGSGAFGPALRNGRVLEQFPGEPIDDPTTPGFTKQFEWVSDGVEANKGYGVRGISSGRMPHFGAILSKRQIDEIVAYERNL